MNSMRECVAMRGAYRKRASNCSMSYTIPLLELAPPSTPNADDAALRDCFGTFALIRGSDLLFIEAFD